MASNQIKHAIGIFHSRQTALQALNELKNTGFPMQKISVIAKTPNSDEPLASVDINPPTITPARGAALGLVQGGMTGGLLALVGGLGVLIIPGFGPALAVESILTAFLGSGASATAGGLIGALRGWFIPEEQAKFYNNQVLENKDYLVMLAGTESEIHDAAAVLSRWDVQQWRVFNPPED